MIPRKNKVDMGKSWPDLRPLFMNDRQKTKGRKGQGHKCDESTTKQYLFQEYILL